MGAMCSSRKSIPAVSVFVCTMSDHSVSFFLVCISRDQSICQFEISRTVVGQDDIDFLKGDVDAALRLDQGHLWIIIILRPFSDLKNLLN